MLSKWYKIQFWINSSLWKSCWATHSPLKKRLSKGGGGFALHRGNRIWLLFFRTFKETIEFTHFTLQFVVDYVEQCLWFGWVHTYVIGKHVYIPSMIVLFQKLFIYIIYSLLNCFCRFLNWWQWIRLRIHIVISLVSRKTGVDAEIKGERGELRTHVEKNS